MTMLVNSGVTGSMMPMPEGAPAIVVPLGASGCLPVAVQHHLKAEHPVDGPGVLQPIRSVRNGGEGISDRGSPRPTSSTD